MEMTGCDSAIEILNKSVQDQIGARSGKWSKEEWSDVSKIIKASVYPVLMEEAGPRDIKRILASIKSGYGCWLDWVEIAMKKTVFSAPENLKE